MSQSISFLPFIVWVSTEWDKAPKARKEQVCYCSLQCIFKDGEDTYDCDVREGQRCSQVGLCCPSSPTEGATHFPCGLVDLILSESMQASFFNTQNPREGGMSSG